MTNELTAIKFCAISSEITTIKFLMFRVLLPISFNNYWATG